MENIYDYNWEDHYTCSSKEDALFLVAARAQEILNLDDYDKKELEDFAGNWDIPLCLDLTVIMASAKFQEKWSSSGMLC